MPSGNAVNDMLYRLESNGTSKPGRHTVEIHASAIIAFRLVVTLTFDLEKLFGNVHSHVELFMPSFV